MTGSPARRLFQAIAISDILTQLRNFTLNSQPIVNTDFATLDRPGRWTLTGVPEGYDALVLTELARQAGGRPVLHVCRDDARLSKLDGFDSILRPAGRGLARAGLGLLAL